jgi:hypothetical protein
MIKYICNQCGKESESIQEDKWIEIGGEKNSFFFRNYSSNRILKNLSTLHFCSEKCFKQHFLIGKKVKP